MIDRAAVNRLGSIDALSAQDIAKLARWLLTAAAEHGERRSYCVIDEFQTVASNIIFQQTAGPGVPFLFANQDLSDLEVKDDGVNY